MIFVCFSCALQAFELCGSLNAVGAILDLHKLLDNRKALPEPASKMAVLEALGEISRTTGAISSFHLAVPRCCSILRTLAFFPPLFARLVWAWKRSLKGLFLSFLAVARATHQVVSCHVCGIIQQPHQAAKHRGLFLFHQNETEW